MKKRLLAPLLCLVLLCAACSNSGMPETTTAVTEAVATEATTEAATGAATEATTEATEVTTEPTTQATEVVEVSHLPYTVKLAAYVGIYEGPSQESGYVRSIAETGVYTIVDEAWDSVGNLWGKLKSGLGWVLVQVSTSYPGPICARCGTVDRVAFSDDWNPGDMCIGCNRDEMHFGDEGLYCSKCGKDFSYMGLDADGTCEFCD